ncbi:MAG: AI-2E family transporter [Lachnospiraceae bacterium]|nr:AI-2E family transporter [Lachnospiraceae bacterium]
MEKEKVIRERRNESLWKKYGGYGVTAFLVIVGAILIIFIFLRFDQFSEVVGKVMRALSPVIIGIVFAYLMNPLMNVFENGMKRVVYKHARKITRAKKFCRVVSLILTMVILFGLISVIIYMLIPELTDTVMGTETTEGLVDILPKQSENLRVWLQDVLNGDSKIASMAKEAFERAAEYLDDFVNHRFINYTSDILSYIASGVWSVFGIVYDIVIGMIFSVYILLSKETFAGHAKKIIFAMFRRRKANAIVRITKQCHGKFTGAITGKIVDSIIIGVLCFIGMMIMNIPYRLLVSVIVTVTNVIPFFGPYIGGVPSAFLILCADPVKALYFVIFLIILQQFDCNFLDPKIVGGSIGLSPFWVLFSCVVFGALFGLPGMLLGVPGMACFYMITKEVVEYKLKRRGLRTDTDYYIDADSVDEQELVLVDPKMEPVRITPEEYEQKIHEEENMHDDVVHDEEDTDDDEDGKH